MTNPAHEIRCTALLDEQGRFRDADLRYSGGAWTRFTVGEPSAEARGEAYVVPALPVDFHCHGVGPYDFSTLGAEGFIEVDRLARRQGLSCVPTLYLLSSSWERILETIRDVGRLSRAGETPNLPGLALEGPLLASAGGTPKKGAWIPEKAVWEAIAEHGELGLRYMVLSPDLFAFHEPPAGLSLEWILGLLAEAGIKPAFGHFRRTSPETSATCLERAIAVVEKQKGAAAPYAMTTDHLFNDMPCNFKYAWRSRADRARRDEEIRRFREAAWSWDDLDRIVGPVPAVILRAARDGRLVLSMNFDGEHVDLEVCRRVVELLGAEKIIAITDRTEARVLGGDPLTDVEGSSLRCQEDGIVAVGSQDIDRQMQNMRRVGLSDAQIWQMFCIQPGRMIHRRMDAAWGVPPREVSYVSEERARCAVYA